MALIVARLGLSVPVAQKLVSGTAHSKIQSYSITVQPNSKFITQNSQVCGLYKRSMDPCITIEGTDEGTSVKVGKNWLSPCLSDLVFVIIAPAALFESDFISSGLPHRLWAQKTC